MLADYWRVESRHARSQNLLAFADLTWVGCRDCRLHDCHPPGLCYPCRTYSSLKPPQADEEAVFICHFRPLPLCQPSKRQALPNDIPEDLRMRHEARR